MGICGGTATCCACDVVWMDYCNYLDGFKDNVFNRKKISPDQVLCDSI